MNSESEGCSARGLLRFRISGLSPSVAVIASRATTLNALDR